MLRSAFHGSPDDSLKSVIKENFAWGPHISPGFVTLNFNKNVNSERGLLAKNAVPSLFSVQQSHNLNIGEKNMIG